MLVLGKRHPGAGAHAELFARTLPALAKMAGALDVQGGMDEEVRAPPLARTLCAQRSPPPAPPSLPY